jgi:hypothetical protein
MSALLLLKKIMHCDGLILSYSAWQEACSTLQCEKIISMNMWNESKKATKLPGHHSYCQLLSILYHSFPMQNFML